MIKKINTREEELKIIEKWKNNSSLFNRILITKKDWNFVKNKNKKMLKDFYYNKLHLSAYSGLINDPNGLAFYKNKFHIFYQWSPFAETHFLKHQGKYTTKDFINFQHEGLAIKPSLKEDINGIYSGGALVEKNNLYIYYTGNVKKNELNTKDTSYTICAKINEKQQLDSQSKKILFEVDHQKYSRDFRDPKPIKINNTFYIIHGARDKANNAKLVLYKSNYPDKEFQFYNEIQFTNQSFFKNAFMFECPDFISFKEKDVLIFSTQGQSYYGKNNEARDCAIFAIGKMNWENAIFELEKIQNIDLGFDFYAPQIFANNKEKIMLAWAGVPNTESTLNRNWSHNLTFPRILEYKNNHIYQKLHSNYSKLRSNNSKNIINNQIVILKEKRLKEFNFSNIYKEFKIIFYNKKNEKFIIEYKNKTLTVHRKDMSLMQAEHYGNCWNRKIEKIENLQLFLDNSLMEIYINEGQYVFTSKYFINGELFIKFQNIQGFYYDLKPINIDWKKPLEILLPGEALVDIFEENSKQTIKVGGAPLNVANAINKLGFNSKFLGSIGNDKNGRLIVNKFEKFNLSKEYLSIIDKKTTQAFVKLDKNGERSFSFKRGADSIVKYNANDIEFDVLVLSSATAFLGKKLWSFYKKILEIAKKEEKIIFFDPNYRHQLYKNSLKDFINKSLYFIKNSHFIKLSEEELFLISEENDKEKAINKIKDNDKQIFFITMGSKGVYLYQNQQNELIPSIKINQIDSTGAGDAFFGLIIGQLLKKYSTNLLDISIKEIRDLVFKANIGAAITTTKKGALESIPNWKKIKDVYKNEKEKF